MKFFFNLFVLVSLLGTVEAKDKPYYLSFSGNYYQQHKSKAGAKHDYFKGRAFTGDLETKYEPGYGAIFAAGYKYERWRFELEGFYRQHKVDKYEGSATSSLSNANSKDEIESYGTVLNAYYDWSLNEWKPYLGLGIGLGTDEFKAEGYSSESFDVVYQFISGISRPLSEKVDLFGEYRFFGSFDATEDDGEYVRAKKAMSILNLGVRYHF